MKRRNIPGMILMIINATLLVASLVLSILFQESLLWKIGIILFSSFFLTYFTLTAIEDMRKNRKEDSPLKRIANCFWDTAITLVGIFLTIKLSSPGNWIIFSIFCLLGVGEVLLSAMYQGKEFKKIMEVTTIFLSIIGIILRSTNILIKILGMIGIFLIYLGRKYSSFYIRRRSRSHCIWNIYHFHLENMCYNTK